MMNTNARNKLRSMGGIMASSPELMRAAQGYQAGGPVMSAPPMIPRVDPVTMPGTGASVVGLGRVPPMQPGRPVADGLPAMSQGSPAQRFAAGVDINPYAPSPSSYLLDEVEERDVTVDDLVESSVSGGSSSRLLNRFPPTEEPSAEELAQVSFGSKRRTGSVTPPREVPPADPDDLNEKAKNLENQAENVVGRGSSNRKRVLEQEAAELRKQAADQAADQASKERLEYFKQGGPGGLENLAAPIRTAVQDPEKAEKIRESLQKTIDEQTPPETGDGGGGDGPPPPEPTKKDLRSRYKEQISLYKEIFGVDDEERARDRMLSLAMMGLAIASGQSPNALTNIAQGAAVGLQGMSEQERARREQERGLQTLALESAIAGQQGEAEAAARAAEQKAEFQNRLDVARIRQGGGKTSGLNRDDTPADVYNAAFATLGKTMSPEEARREALRQAQDHLVLISPRLAEEQIKAERAALKSLAAGQADPVQDWITERREQDVPDEKIRELLKKKGHEPEDYGL